MNAESAIEETLRETSFAVEGLFCAGCAATVERALGRLPGVQEVSVSFLADAAWVRHDPARVDAEVLSERLIEIGYNTRPIDAAGTRVRQAEFQRSHAMRLAVAVGFGMWIMLATVARYFTDLPDPAFAWWLGVASGALSLPVLCYSGAAFFRLGWRGLRAGVPGMESLILLATLAATGASVATLARGGHETWFEVPVMLILFQLIARLGDFGARRRAADAMRAMLDLSPERARRVGTDEQVGIGELAIGELIESHAGERLAVDGVITRGTASLDNALISGESMPGTVGIGDAVLAGTLNIDGTLQIRVTTAPGQRTLDRLAADVGRALSRRSDLAKFVDRVAGWLVPVVLAAALFAFLLALATGASASDALVRALATLVVSCPCALSLAVPLVVAGTASRASREGILLRDPAVLEQAGRIDTVLLDKTGTLTAGTPSVARVLPQEDCTVDEVLRLAALAEAGSSHPLARAIVRHAAAKAGSFAQAPSIAERHERAGAGVRATLQDGRTLLAGSAGWLEENGVHDLPAPIDHGCSRVLVAMDGALAGSIELADTVRDDTVALIDGLRARGLRLVLASGDSAGAARALAERLDIEWQAPLDPAGKSALVETLRAQGHRVAFVGDGLNDAPALARSDLGIATGEASDLARSAAALSILDGGLARVDLALKLAARAASTLRTNLLLASVYNAVLLPLALLGYVHPLLAVAAMALSVLSVSLNSLRVLGRLAR